MPLRRRPLRLGVLPGGKRLRCGELELEDGALLKRQPYAVIA